LLRICQRQI